MFKNDVNADQIHIPPPIIRLLSSNKGCLVTCCIFASSFKPLLPGTVTCSSKKQKPNAPKRLKNAQKRGTPDQVDSQGPLPYFGFLGSVLIVICQIGEGVLELATNAEKDRFWPKSAIFGQKQQLWGSVSAPGIFFGPCPTSDLLGGALSAVRAQCNYLILWALLLFDNGTPPTPPPHHPGAPP